MPTDEELIEEDRRRQAAGIASGYLASQGVGGYSAPPPEPPPPAPIGPPAPPPKPHSPFFAGAGTEPGGVDPQARNAKMISRNGQMVDPNTLQTVEGSRQVQPGASGSSGPVKVADAGFRPNTREMEAKLGKPVPQETRELALAGAKGRLAGADIENQAAKELYAHQRDASMAAMQADRDAGAKMALVAAEQKKQVDARLAEVERLNREAVVKPEDGWNDRLAFAGMLSALFAGIGMASKSFGGMVAGGVTSQMLNGFMNQDIQSRLNAKKSAGEQAKRQTDLLHIYMDKFGSERQAIDATRLAQLDSINKQLDIYKAEHGAAISEANYQNAKATVSEMYGKTLNDFAKQSEAEIALKGSEKWHEAQYAGATGVTRKEPNNIVTLADGTSYAFPTEKSANGAYEKIEAKQRLVRLNNQISQIRKETHGLSPITDFTKYRANIARLEELEQDKLKAIETANQQGVLREGEYDRAKMMTGHATGGLDFGLTKPLAGPLKESNYEKADAVIQQQTERWTEDLHQIPHAVGGHLVERGYQINPATGEYEPTARYTGQDAKPSPGLAPRSAEGMDPNARFGRMNAPDTETTEPGKILPYVPHTKAEAKQKKKDEEE